MLMSFISYNQILWFYITVNVIGFMQILKIIYHLIS